MTLIIFQQNFGTQWFFITMIQLSPLIVWCSWTVATRGRGRGPGSRGLGGRVEARFVLLHSVLLYIGVRSYLVVHVVMIVYVSLKGLVGFVIAVDLIVGLHLVGMKCGLMYPVVGSCPVNGTPRELGGVGHG